MMKSYLTGGNTARYLPGRCTQYALPLNREYPETGMNETLPLILIVDDDPRGCEALEGLLCNQGYELVFARDGRDALAMAMKRPPDLVLLDVMMPGMDGFEVCRVMRADARLSEAPVVMLTALDDQESRLRGIETGADDFISKPFNRTELRARIRTITRLNRYRRLQEERTKLEDAHLELQTAYAGTIEGWARALELRDLESAGHSRRVTEMTLALCVASGIEAEQVEHIRRGALLHDIGKMGIPDRILLKPGPLDEEEWKIMKKHPQYARELLSSIEFLIPAIDIPFCHHEKWDGTGYPQGLKGERIPLAARLFAVVDVWDALSSDRPYRKAWSVEQISHHIKSLVNLHFDASVVDAFLKVLEYTGACENSKEKALERDE
jgi:putative two-component system response regulator